MTTATNLALCKKIIETCLNMNKMGINQGTSGNVSAKVKGGILVTPSAMPYDKMKPKDIVFLSKKGVREKGKLPTTEWRFHLDISNSRKDVKAIVHTHSIFATIMSILREKIPAYHYLIAAAGGPTIRCAKYATFGTEKLSNNALAALKDRNACLLANHGVIAVGDNLDKALWLANEVEVLAKQCVFAKLLGGKGHVLGNAEIKLVKDKMADYGIKS